MLVAMSQRARRFVGRLDRGEELVSALRALCKERDVRAGEIRGSGLLASAEIAPYDREARGYAAPRRLRSFFELVHLHGTIASRGGETTVTLHATLARDNQDRGGGIDILGGLLHSAEVLTFEFMLDAMDDLTLTREFDPALGIYTLARAEARTFETPAARASAATVPPVVAHPPPATAHPERAPHVERPAPHGAAAPSPHPPATRASMQREPPREPQVLRARPKAPPKIPEGRPPPPRAPGPAAEASGAGHKGPGEGEVTWADAVARSEQLGEEPESSVHLGDILEHPNFGQCEVQRIDEGSERIAVRLTNGRLVELGLEVLHLERLRTEGNRQRFRVHSRR
jgi:predicted DNA-binding protein with PD1-like motif